VSIKSFFYLVPNISADRRTRDWTAGFLLIGILMAVPGPMMVAWRYQLENDPRTVGLHFLALNGSLLLVAYVCHLLRRHLRLRPLLATGCVFAVGGFLSFVFSSPPVRAEWRMAGMGLLGAGAGVLLYGLSFLLRPYYAEQVAATLNWGGLLVASGSLLLTLAVGSAYSLHSMQWEAGLLLLFPLAFLFLYLRRDAPAAAGTELERRRTSGDPMKDLRSIAAVLFSLVLFFQFGNEWSLAGWLPLFVIHRLGASPPSAIFVLALFFAALLTGRLFTPWLLRSLRHSRLLLISVITAMLGCLLLSETNTLTGAALATVVAGLSLAPIYPLTANRIGRRFGREPISSLHIFSLAATGGMLAPGLVGLVAYYVGLNYILWIPALGSLAVLLLMWSILFENKLMKANVEPPRSIANRSSRAAGAGGDS
jgi:MFS transporter, FHS family, glucose/mannose:H+ symporter